MKQGPISHTHEYITAATLPTTCAELVAAGIRTDGEYMLNTTNTGVIQIYCHNMAGTPTEYITLTNPTNNYGYSDYGPGYLVEFQKIRFNPMVC